METDIRWSADWLRSGFKTYARF